MVLVQVGQKVTVVLATQNPFEGDGLLQRAPFEVPLLSKYVEIAHRLERDRIGACKINAKYNPNP